MRFVLKCKEDEEDVWKGVKSAINSKCRAKKDLTSQTSHKNDPYDDSDLVETLKDSTS
jgi:hypothetical protein